MTGQTVTHYQVVEKLAEGASAVVYRAIDLSLGREVVLKVLSPSGPDRDGVARFQHEARTISSLNHPNICTIYEIGEHDGRPFLAMEMLDGEVLAKTIGGHPLRTGRVLDIGSQIAGALDAAHAERIVHRDLKPANIVVTRSGRIKLLDFGIAVLLPRRAALSTSGQPPSSKSGTIPYMSPEQSQAEDLDHRSDLFSLGIILYEMATGRRPFAGATPSEMMSAIVSAVPVAPRAINPDIPPELERIITKSLEKKPSLRYQTASDLKADLQRLERDIDHSGAAALVSPETPPKKNRPRWLAASGAAATLIAAGGWFGVTAVRDRPFPTRSTPSSPPVSQVEAPVGAAREADVVLPAEPRPTHDVAGTAATPVKPTPSPAPSADQLAVARRQIDLQLYDQAIETLRKIARGSDRRHAIEASFLLASVQDRRGEFADAMGTYIEIATRFAGDPRAPEALARLAQTTLKSKRRDSERDAWRTLNALVEKYPDSAWAPRALLVRGELEARQGTYQRDDALGGSVPSAAVTYRRIVKRYPSSDAVPSALQRLAGIYTDMKRFAQAAATFEQLAARDLDGRFDAWFAAAEIYEKHLKDMTRARAAYAHVPPSSPHYADALKRR